MTAAPMTEAARARDLAAHEMVGTMRTLLMNAERDRLGRVVITLSGPTLDYVIDTYNRASYSVPFSADDVGRPSR